MTTATVVGIKNFNKFLGWGCEFLSKKVGAVNSMDIAKLHKHMNAFIYLHMHMYGSLLVFLLKTSVASRSCQILDFLCITISNFLVSMLAEREEIST